ncbi:Hypothetical predicted protein [Xyrichtys novacula]|uniref:Uncharacterized protein n=1 Tax=Xyrichtys novacula TaxID=13765 RepID=A0AAV1HRT3_XYRNO|nr:Hypothetical predicted protein [Xyrichtys novacula]
MSADKKTALHLSKIALLLFHHASEETRYRSKDLYRGAQSAAAAARRDLGSFQPQTFSHLSADSVRSQHGE